ncbi:GTPase domain-containing protein [uncultured Acetobacterium sp.]|uniref:GTPase n=1 Tax=uncultured Acetobacterium sp. TaxID=217139 RepID=UPI0025FC644D|nr:GTPase domain-containing protein [uncultured Acetobacterium sp.]
MDKKLKTNVLMIGKSGVGKSSLLNYIFGLELEKTGTGRPVTAEGLYQHAYDCGAAFTINLYDTWGLEANQAERWKDLIMTEVKRHDCDHIAEWFHTIIYVFSAKSARIEGFEKAIIRELIDQGNRVMTVLSHCDLPNVDGAIHEMEAILQELGIERRNIVRACSVSKKLLGGIVTEPFGLEDVIHNIRENLWQSICLKVPGNVLAHAQLLLEKWRNDVYDYIEETVTVFNASSQTTVNRINDYAGRSVEAVYEAIGQYGEEKMAEAITYYCQLANQLSALAGERTGKPEWGRFTDFDFSRDRVDVVCELLANVVVGLIPFAVFFLPSINRDNRVQEFKDGIDASYKRILETLSHEAQKLGVQLLLMQAA